MADDFPGVREEFLGKCMRRVDRITLICLCSDRNVAHFKQTEALIARVEKLRHELVGFVTRCTLRVFCKRIEQLELEASDLIITRRGTFRLSLYDGDHLILEGESADWAEGARAGGGLDGEGLGGEPAS